MIKLNLNTLHLSFIFFSLIFSGPQIYAEGCINYSADENQARMDCNKETGKKWSCEVHRCVDDEEASKLKDQWAECQNKKTEKEQKKCFKKFTGNVDEDALPEEYVLANEILSYGVAAVFALYMAVHAALSKFAPGACPMALSYIGMLAAGVIGMGIQIGTRIYYAIEGEKLVKKYEKLRKKGEKDKQVQAFDYLYKDMKLKYEIEIAKAVGFGVSSGLFIATAAKAGHEAYAQWGEASCVPVKKDGGGGGIMGFIKKAGSSAPGMASVLPGAGGASTTAAATTAASNASDEPVEKNVYSKLTHPLGRMILSLAMIPVSLYMMSVSAAAADITKKRMEKVKSTKKHFEATLNGFANCEDRDDISNPLCYCYIEDGSKNQNRLNSETCKKYWASINNVGREAPEATNYSITEGIGDAIGCVQRNGVYDKQCKCRKTLRSDGQNNCLKTDQTTLGINFGAGSIGNKLLDKIGKLSQGDFSGTDINPNDIKSFAAAAGSKQLKLNKQLGNKLRKEGIKQRGTSTADQLAYLRGLKSNLSPNNLKIAKNLNKLGNKKSLSKDLLKNLKVAKNLSNVKSGSALKYASAKVTSKKKKKDTFNFNMGGPKNVGGTVLNLKGGPAKRYKMRDNDLHKSGGGPNLWNLLRDRYQKSALEKLFNEDEK